MNDPTSVETKIITAAIDCIEKYGIQGATNRKIALAAGVNNAAINYYFRSKEQLIQRCMQVTLENAFDFQDFERLPGASARERCAAIFNDLIAGGVQYPGITRAHFFSLLNEGKYDALAVEKLNEFARSLAQDLAGREAGSGRGRTAVGLRPDDLHHLDGNPGPEIISGQFWPGFNGCCRARSALSRGWWNGCSDRLEGAKIMLLTSV